MIRPHSADEIVVRDRTISKRCATQPMDGTTPLAGKLQARKRGRATEPSVLDIPRAAHG